MYIVVHISMKGKVANFPSVENTAMIIMSKLSLLIYRQPIDKSLANISQSLNL